VGTLLINLDIVTSITSSEPFPVWQARRRLFAESILIKSNFPLSASHFHWVSWSQGICRRNEVWYDKER
jgi:hypothetical protein